MDPKTLDTVHSYVKETLPEEPKSSLETGETYLQMKQTTFQILNKIF